MLRIGIGVIASVLLSAAAAHANEQCPVRGGELKIPFAIDPGDLTPGKKAQFPPSQIFDQIYDTLLTRDSTGLKPGLASSYTVAPDNLSITFTLRQGVMFHHGREFEAKDVVYTLERLLDPAFNSPWAAQLKSVDKVEAVDKHTVRIALKEPFAPILSILATAWYTAIVPYDFAPANNANEKASGTGPFMLVEYVPNDHVTLKANPNYWEKGFPCLDTVRYVIMPEQQAQISAFRQGTADLVALTDPKFIPILKNAPGSRLIEPAGAVNESGLGINTAEGPTKDVRVRRALSLATNRKAVIDTVLFGYGEVGTKISCGKAPYGWCEGKDPPLPYYQHDPQEARKLLAEAGYPKGLDLTMQVSLPLDVQTAEILAEQWKAAGINLKIEQNADFNKHLDNFINVRHQLSIVSLVWQPDPHVDVYPIYYSTSKINLGKFADPKLDALLDAGKTELDVTKRIKIYKDIQRLVADQAYMLYPYTKPVSWQYVKDYVKNYKTTATGSFSPIRYVYIQK
ncbi:ABC transporter substrate-binding protein [Vineibacter terrae]|uniref:ABC transporter substrate-binding protein n=1 Tax=Vineibacter terrae TaxID=2586908 RepID=UPI002E37B475|nr:ABC transporter substrate-binding protein [Vineibacter terrae]HEX2889272.1 ABC transporter substrate-binding protein [Vineibacter terrae]